MSSDAIVIGSGQAGVPLAVRLAEAGITVTLFEAGHLGGTCINVGCTPTKTMVASARAAHVARGAERLGVRAGTVSVDLSAVVDRKNAIVDQWRAGVERRLVGAGDRLKVVRGQARLVGERLIEAGGQRYGAKTVILNVGARPRVPTVSELDEVDWFDSSSIMDVRELPEHLTIMGGGYIGCAFGQMFRRFGAGVTIMQRGVHLLPGEDLEISKAVEDLFRSEGIKLILSAEVVEVADEGGRVTVRCDGGQRTQGSHLLVAVGRVPNTDDLGCERAGDQAGCTGICAGG